MSLNVVGGSCKRKEMIGDINLREMSGVGNFKL